MIKPFIYSVCDQRYHDLYAGPFLKSARRHGHQAKVFCNAAETDKAFFVFWRYALLPTLLKTYSHVLMVDVDSVFLKPVEIEPDFDAGIFFRNTDKRKAVKTKTLGGIFYCSRTGAEFADYLAEKMAAADQSWYVDQQVLWNVYSKIGDRFRVKKFDRETIDWNYPTEASIYTAKGNRKLKSEFLRQIAQ